MNCKPGDLAIIVRNPNTVTPACQIPPGSFGTQVRCLRYVGHVEANCTAGTVVIADAWKIEPIKIEGCFCDCCPDSALMPIRPEPEPESERREESLSA